MVLIIGCGYVGEKVGLLLKEDPSLVVTTRSEKNALELKKTFSSVTTFDIADIDSLSDLIREQETIIITLAPKNSNLYAETYLKAAFNLKQVINLSPVKQLIYTSSSSVYGDYKGTSVTEDMPLLGITDQAKILIETEKTLLSLKTTQRTVCIFRVSEIYGPSREFLHRVKSLQGKKAPGDGSQPTNMIHVEDVARAIVFAMKHSLNGVYNLCNEDHMTRKELYDKISNDNHLPLVQWDPDLTSIHFGRRILSNEKIKKEGFNFTHSRAF